jgi:signal transduction histidine kinase
VEKERKRASEKELEQAREIKKAYTELKVTQNQLIHAEKMASLGELTAGIAHEIQNPLNFVNNFSEVSEDLIDEMQEDLLNGNKAEAENIITDLKQNLKKINHHGKRASSIVHGMLEHSRTGKKEKEPTDINLLADEYLRLAYHGLRAKNKSFHAEFKAELDESLPKVNVIAQNIGRVLLNLINNPFYAVDKKAKEGLDGYKPLVILSTKKVGEKVEVAVKDNGPGIPIEIKEKIFQPFFTTKPTGSGTGLGLSLSYDIVKAHGGELKAESDSENGTVFLLTIPAR